MQLLFTDDSNNLKLFVAIDKIGHIEFSTNAAVLYFVPGFEVWVDSARLFVVGNSRQELEKALMNQLDRVTLRESDVLTDEEFVKWNQRTQKQEMTGLLEAAELVRVG